MTTLSTYQGLIEKVGLSNLNEANKEAYNIVKEGSSNFTNSELWNDMLSDSDIREAYEMHVKALERLASETITEKEKELEKEFMKKADKKAARTKSVKTKKASRKVSKPSKKRVKKAAKRVKTAKKRTAMKDPVKFPVTVKKFSKEIQLIRRMINMHGKRKGIGSLNSLDRDLQKTLKMHPDRKPVLREIAKRVSSAVTKANEAGVKEVDITLEKDFLEQLKSANSPKPKMKVEYLGGTPKKKAKKKVRR